MLPRASRAGSGHAVTCLVGYSAYRRGRSSPGLWIGLQVSALWLVCLGTGCGSEAADATARPKGDEARAVRLVRAEAGGLARTVTATGTLAAEDQVVLNTKVAGRLATLPVDLGSVVHAGDVVAVLDLTDFRLRVEQARDGAHAGAGAARRAARRLRRRGRRAERRALVRQAQAVAGAGAPAARPPRRRCTTTASSSKAELDQADADFRVAEARSRKRSRRCGAARALVAERRAALRSRRAGARRRDAAGAVRRRGARAPALGRRLPRRRRAGRRRSSACTRCASASRCPSARRRRARRAAGTPPARRRTVPWPRARRAPEPGGRRDARGRCSSRPRSRTPTARSAPAPSRPRTSSSTRSSRRCSCRRMPLVTFAGVTKVLGVDRRPRRREARAARPARGRPRRGARRASPPATRSSPSRETSRPGQAVVTRLRARAEARRGLHPPPRLRDDAHPGARRRRRRGLRASSASTASPPSTSRRSACARRCPARRPRRWRPRSRSASRRPSTRSRGSTSCARSRAPGSCVIAANFEPRPRRRRGRAGRARPRLGGARRPARASLDPPVVAKFDNESSPVLTVALSADRPLRELTDLADRIVKVQLERSRGRRRGGARRRPRARDQRLGRRRPAGGARAPDHGGARRRPAPEQPGARRQRHHAAPSSRASGRSAGSPTRAAFDDLVLATRDGTPIRVRDVGWAEDGTKEQRSIARLDDVPTVILEVRRQSGANTVAVIEAVEGEPRRASPRSCPPDVTLEVIRDQSRYIYAALHEITRPPRPRAASSPASSCSPSCGAGARR